MKINIFMLLLVYFVTGCSHHSNMIKHSHFKDYALDVTKTAYIGESIIKVRDYYIPVDSESVPKCSFMIPSNDFTISGKYTKKAFFDYDITIKVNKQGKYKSSGSIEIDGQNYQIVDFTDSNGALYGLLIDKNGNININTIYNDDHDHLMSSANASLIPQEVKLTEGELVPCETKDTESKLLIGHINYELLYGGINNVTLTLTYREFTRDDMAKSSFFQNVVYETNVKQLRYKDFKIEVLDANNEKIVYKVISDGLKDSIFNESNPPLDYKNILYEEELKEKLRK